MHKSLHIYSKKLYAYIDYRVFGSYEKPDIIFIDHHDSSDESVKVTLLQALKGEKYGIC